MDKKVINIQDFKNAIKQMETEINDINNFYLSHKLGTFKSLFFKKTDLFKSVKTETDIFISATFKTYKERLITDRKNKIVVLNNLIKKHTRYEG